jgi:indolepyruvate ferredoxin oxidoreductase beta subunit
VTEYMHPRAREICEALPAPLARLILRSRPLRGTLERAFSKGRHVRTSSLGWNLALRLVAALRVVRRSTLRFAEEQHRIEAWLALAAEIAPADPELAAELIQGQELIKGYGDTFDRGLANFETLVATAREIRGRAGAAGHLCAVRTAALAVDEGTRSGSPEDHQHVAQAAQQPKRRIRDG